MSELRGQLFSFEGRYIRQVGVLYRQLDEWEERIAELHAKGRPDEDLEAKLDEESGLAEGVPAEHRSINLRALFRELAKRIHPDFASSAADELRRTYLMAQANDALRRKDQSALQRMLNGFEPLGVMTAAQNIEAEITSIVTHLHDVALDIETAVAEREALAHSELAKLQERTIDAALHGRDLLAEMAARVKGRIGLAMRQYELDLDRIKRPPAGPSVESLVTAETYRAPRFDTKRRVWVK